MTTTIEQTNDILNPYPLSPNEQRVSLWEHAQGIWKDRRPDPIEELEEQRHEWNKELPTIS